MIIDEQFPKKDYYAMLGVRRDATEGEIKQAYHEKARKSHPDRGGAASNFTDIREARNTLLGMRQGYDEFLASVELYGNLTSQQDALDPPHAKRPSSRVFQDTAKNWHSSNACGAAPEMPSETPSPEIMKFAKALREGDDVAVCKALNAEGATVKVNDLLPDGQLPLICATRHGHTTVVRSLLHDLLANASLTDSFDGSAPQTAMHVAAKLEHLYIMNELAYYVQPLDAVFDLIRDGLAPQSVIAWGCSMAETRGLKTDWLFHVAECAHHNIEYDNVSMFEKIMASSGLKYQDLCDYCAPRYYSKSTPVSRAIGRESFRVARCMVDTFNFDVTSSYTDSKATTPLSELMARRAHLAESADGLGEARVAIDDLIAALCRRRSPVTIDDMVSIVKAGMPHALASVLEVTSITSAQAAFLRGIATANKFSSITQILLTYENIKSTEAEAAKRQSEKGRVALSSKEGYEPAQRDKLTTQRAAYEKLLKRAKFLSEEAAVAEHSLYNSTIKPVRPQADTSFLDRLTLRGKGRAEAPMLALPPSNTSEAGPSDWFTLRRHDAPR